MLIELAVQEVDTGGRQNRIDSSMIACEFENSVESRKMKARK